MIVCIGIREERVIGHGRDESSPVAGGVILSFHIIVRFIHAL